MFFERTFRSWLEEAGITVNGGQLYDMRVHNPWAFLRITVFGSLGLGEAYMVGWWECHQLDEFFYKLLSKRLDQRFKPHPLMVWGAVQARLLNVATSARAYALGQSHYSLGNDLFSAMLGPSLAYSCGFWEEGAQTLDQAQEAKFKLTCQKLKLKPGMKVLDIGCGFGTLAAYLARHYQVSVVGITVSKEQLKLGQELCQGLDVELELQDYRQLKGQQFDRVVSLGMFEHVEPKNYSAFMQIAHGCLKPGGIFLLHTIGGFTGGSPDPWIRRYIFPVGQIPTEAQIRQAAGELFSIRDWHWFGQSYDRTLMAWRENFRRSWPQLQQKYGHLANGCFERMWEYYLLSCAGAFRANALNLWQIVMTRKGDKVEYQPYWQQALTRATLVQVARPFLSAMPMLNFYINRAGKNLNVKQRRILQQAKI